MRNEIYAADMHFLLSGLPNPTAPRGRTGSLPLGLAGESRRERRTQPSRPSALGIQGLTHGRPSLRPARPARATGLEGRTGPCSDTLVSREVTLETSA